MKDKLRSKLEELVVKLEETQAKLAQKKIGHTGVVHEDAASELQEMQVKVYEAHEISLLKEIQEIKDKLGEE